MVNVFVFPYVLVSMGAYVYLTRQTLGKKETKSEPTQQKALLFNQSEPHIRDTRKDEANRRWISVYTDFISGGQCIKYQ